MRILFYGWNGYIGSQLCQLLQEQHIIIHPQIRLGSSSSELEAEIVSSQCDCIINSAGLTGRPNVDWCEINRELTKKINLDSAIELAALAKKHSIYHVIISSGCIYQYTQNQPNDPLTIGFSENDEPNFVGSYYSQTKFELEQWLIDNTDSLIVRLRMPLDCSLPLNPRNLLAKITSYSKLITDAWQSVSVLDNLLPILTKQIDHKVTGVFNYVNPGPVTHPEILAASPFKTCVFEPISLYDLQVLAPRSFCILSPRKLTEWCRLNSIDPPMDAISAIKMMFGTE